MTQLEGYGSPAAVEAAIAAAARTSSAADPSLTVQERIRLEYFHRFLSRVFSEAHTSEWMLKGGTGILARVASARTTTDIDLFRRDRSLDAALADLRHLATIDLGDFFRFDYTGHTDSVGGNQQTYTEGYQVSFDVYVGVKKKDSFHVDLVVNATTTDDVEITLPANSLDLPKLPSNSYRLYPTVDQIADKVCATIALYGGRPSSREKDLVDLVVFAVTQDVDANKLQLALAVEAGARSLALPEVFRVPTIWGSRYAKLAEDVPACGSYRTVSAAMMLMHSFLDPALNGVVVGKTWDHSRLSWS